MTETLTLTPAPDRANPAGATPDGGFGVYVHWPFCAAKCPYCDFNSHVRHGGVDEPRFAAALVRELQTVARLTDPSGPAQTVFFGGGTPSLMAPASVATILEAIARTIGLAADAEISLEANPTSVEAERFAGYRAAGVNRVSLGVQSLRDEALVALGRLHDAATARAALAIARDTFDQVSADMIYARPGQTVADWRTELAEMIAIAGDHLSLYQLTIEPGTRYFALAESGRLVVPDDDLAADLYEATAELTAASGYRRYEVSNHARPGAEARHNLIYWRGGRYLGIGPGAHGRVDVDGRRTATRTLLMPEAWRDAVERQGHGAVFEPLDRQAVADEALLMGLRVAEGVSLAALERRGLTLDRGRIEALAADGLVKRSGDTVAVPPSATLLTNAIVRELIP